MLNRCLSDTLVAVRHHAHSLMVGNKRFQNGNKRDQPLLGSLTISNPAATPRLRLGTVMGEPLACSPRVLFACRPCDAFSTPASLW